MSINAIGAGCQNQAKLPTPIIEETQQTPRDPSEVSKLNAEIKQTEAEMKETMKEVQKAATESMDGGSEKAQMLQSKILMQQQEIMTKQLQIKEMESPKDPNTEQVLSAIEARPRFDRYEAEKEGERLSDHVYRLEEKDGTRQIIFNREERSENNEKRRENNWQYFR